VNAQANASTSARTFLRFAQKSRNYGITREFEIYSWIC
jgi:hypothetical protein